MGLFRRDKKELGMIWRVAGAGGTSYLLGTAHFFPYSFRDSLAGYIRDVRFVVAEGPLEVEDSRRVVEAGRAPPGAPHFFDLLDRETVEKVTRALGPSCRTPQSFLIFDYFRGGDYNPVRELVRDMKPWRAFFTIWALFLRKHGWKYSVDLEAYEVGREMGRETGFLETIQEQIAVLESLSPEIITEFLQRIDDWPAYSRKYIKNYLAGDEDGIRSNVHRFPTRHRRVIDDRDRIMFERMLPYIDRAPSLICVGAPHIKGVKKLLVDSGRRVEGPGPF